MTTGDAMNSRVKRKNEGEVEKNKERNMKGKKKVQMNDRNKLEDERRTKKNVLEKQCWRKKRSVEQVANDISEEEIAAFTPDYTPSPRSASIKVEEFIQYFAIKFSISNPFIITFIDFYHLFM